MPRRAAVIALLAAAFATGVTGQGTPSADAAEQTIGATVLPTLGVDLSAPVGARVRANTGWEVIREERDGVVLITIVPH